MKDFIVLLRALERLEDPAQKYHAILTWAENALNVSGAALLSGSVDSAPGVVVVAAEGTLASLAQDIARGLSQRTLPGKPGILALPPGISPKADIVFAQPLDAGSGSPRGALILQGSDMEDIARSRGDELFLLCGIMKQTMTLERMAMQLAREKAFAGAFAAGSPLGSIADAKSLAVLTDGLQLPLYMCAPDGHFLYASPSFLTLTDHLSLKALTDNRTFFSDPVKRSVELETVRAVGTVTDFPLSVMSGKGRKIEIHDSAVNVGTFILGVFFDVTRFMASNRDLKDALQVQELLNDSIIAASQTLQRTQSSAIRALARLAEYRVPETGLHLQRICEYSRLLAQEVYERSPYAFRITVEYPSDISISSMLHDIGKVSIPDSVLLKPGKLDPDEWELMKKHTISGWEVLHKADKELGEQSFLTLASTIALSHHERFDGTGYPNAISGDAIPLSARIAALADVYDALTTARPYKEPWSHDRAVAEISGQSGKQFDPTIVEIFLDINGQFDDVRSLFPG